MGGLQNQGLHSVGQSFTGFLLNINDSLRSAAYTKESGESDDLKHVAVHLMVMLIDRTRSDNGDTRFMVKIVVSIVV